MMSVKLMCIGCGSELSGALEILSSKDPSTPKPDFEDQKPITAAGKALESWEPMQSGYQVELNFVPQYWMNPSDIENNIIAIDDPSKLNGCCGYDGSDGPNMCCKTCNAVVGTRQSDCWTPNVFIPKPNATRWVSEEEIASFAEKPWLRFRNVKKF
jgi:hypothetical protein